MLFRHPFPHAALITLTKITQQCVFLLDLLTADPNALCKQYIPEHGNCSSLLCRSLAWGGTQQLFDSTRSIGTRSRTPLHPVETMKNLR